MLQQLEAFRIAEKLLYMHDCRIYRNPWTGQSYPEPQPAYFPDMQYFLSHQRQTASMRKSLLNAATPELKEKILVALSKNRSEQGANGSLATLLCIAFHHPLYTLAQFLRDIVSDNDVVSTLNGLERLNIVMRMTNRNYACLLQYSPAASAEYLTSVRNVLSVQAEILDVLPTLIDNMAMSLSSDDGNLYLAGMAERQDDWAWSDLAGFSHPFLMDASYFRPNARSIPPRAPCP